MWTVNQKGKILLDLVSLTGKDARDRNLGLGATHYPEPAHFYDAKNKREELGTKTSGISTICRMTAFPVTQTPLERR